MGAFEITYRPAARKDIVSIPIQDQLRIKIAIETKLRPAPFLYGVPLHGNLKGFHKLRIGQYRIVFEVREKIIEIFCIGLRKNVYEKVEGRR